MSALLRKRTLSIRDSGVGAVRYRWGVLPNTVQSSAAEGAGRALLAKSNAQKTESAERIWRRRTPSQNNILPQL